jgi:hypothetical protein
MSNGVTKRMSTTTKQQQSNNKATTKTTRNGVTWLQLLYVPTPPPMISRITFGASKRHNINNEITTKATQITSKALRTDYAADDIYVYHFGSKRHNINNEITTKATRITSNAQRTDYAADDVYVNHFRSTQTPRCLSYIQLQQATAAATDARICSVTVNRVHIYDIK